MAAIVSVSQLFATGQLGGLNTALSLHDAAMLLGAPVSWSEANDPLHGDVWVWHYGALELVFDREPPWSLLFFAIDDLPQSLDPGGCRIIGNQLGRAMVLDLEHVTRQMRPSDALSLLGQRGAETSAVYWPLEREDTLDPSLLIIAASDVAISFEVWEDEVAGNAAIGRLPDDELWSRLEAHASVQRLMCGPRAAHPVGSRAAVVPRRLVLPPAPPAADRHASGAPGQVLHRLRPAVARVRFNDFLTTGHLGPVHCDLNRSQIALLLGPPEGWIAESSGEQWLAENPEKPPGEQPALPPYWSYGKLEISFDPRPRHAITFFQIEAANLLSGDCEIVAAGRIVLELQGLCGRSRPSEFLRLMRDGATSLNVIYSRPSDTASFILQVINGKVVVVFDSHFPEATLPMIAAPQDPAYLRQCDRFAQLDSIYVYAESVGDAPPWPGTIKISAVEYLAAVDTETQ